jgi:hypothetical protein
MNDMSRKKGIITFFVDNKKQTLTIKDAIHLDEENGKRKVNKQFTQDNVFFAINSTVNRCDWDKIHEIYLSLEDGTPIAYSSTAYSIMKFSKEEI